MWAVIDSIVCEINSWVLVKKEFSNCSLNDMVRDWVTCITNLNNANHVPSLSWNPLEVEIYKFNFDGASSGNLGPSAFGCIMRDTNGQIMGVKGSLFGLTNAIHAEAMGLLEGLKLARDKGIKGCIIEGDSSLVIS